MIDHDGIVDAVSSLSLVGNEEGLIPAFGLYLTRHYAGYYNKVSFSYLHQAEKMGPEATTLARAALTESGHVCAFNTFGGIMLSQEWEAVVAPMIETREDWIRGMVAVVNAFGWGVWQVDALEGGKELRATVKNSYESTGYLDEYPLRTSEGGVCFLASASVAGLMNLLYHGDITKRPPLSRAYYRETFAGKGRFVAEEVKCRSKGDASCEFVAIREA